MGALLNDMRHPWFVDLLDGLTEGLAEQGRQVLLNSGRLDRTRDDAATRALADLGVDGLLLVGTQAGWPMLAEVAAVVPTVAVAWRDLDLPHVDTVGNDDLLGGALATRHLLDLGHRRIAHIAGHVPGSANTVGALRRRGYEDTMRDHGLADHVQVETADYTDDGGYRPPSGSCAPRSPPRDLHRRRRGVPRREGGRGRVRAERARGPSLVGYDNSPLARLRSIWLTSVDSGGAEVGRLAARTLAARIDDPTGLARCTCSRQRCRCAGPPALPVDMRARAAHCCEA